MSKRLKVQQKKAIATALEFCFSIDVLKMTTLLSDRGASVPSLMTGSSYTSPAPSDGNKTNDVVLDTSLYQEKGVFSVEEENLEKVLQLMQWEVQELKAQLQESQSEAVRLQAAIVHQQQILITRRGQQVKTRVRDLWETNCQQLLSPDNIGLQSHGSAARLFHSNSISQQSTTEQLRGVSQLMNAQGTGVTWVINLCTCVTLTDPLASQIPSIGTSSQLTSTCLPMIPHLQLDSNPLMHQRGKAPPINKFTAEDKCITFDDWLPILESAATCNGWSKEESLMQLAGHIRGRAL